MDKGSKLAVAFVTVTLAALFFLHRDLTVTLGNSEWDYAANKTNRGYGTLDRTASFREALHPDPFYGQGYAVVIWAVRSGAGCLGLWLDPFRAAQSVTFVFSLAFVLAAAAGNHKPSVLILPGVPGDEEIYHWAVRYRLRRIKANFVLASRPITVDALKETGLTAPLFVLRVPISDTGPSVVFDWLRGRPRQVYHPDSDPVLDEAQLVAHDRASGVELHRIDRNWPATDFVKRVIRHQTQ